MKQPEPTDEDRAAAIRLSAVAARHRFVMAVPEPEEAPQDRPKARKSRKSRSG